MREVCFQDIWLTVRVLSALTEQSNYFSPLVVGGGQDTTARMWGVAKLAISRLYLGNRKEKTRSEFYDQCLRHTPNDVTSPNKPKLLKFLCPLSSSIGMTFQIQTAAVTGAPSLRLAAFKKMFAYRFEDNCFVRGSMCRYLLLFAPEELESSCAKEISTTEARLQSALQSGTRGLHPPWSALQLST